jgi:hypothetical protein
MSKLKYLLVTDVEIALSDKFGNKLKFKVWHYMVALALAWLIIPFVPVQSAIAQAAILLFGFLTWLSYGVIGRAVRKDTRVNLVLMHRMFVFLYSIIASIALAIWYIRQDTHDAVFGLVFWPSAVIIGLILVANAASILVQLYRGKKDIKNMGKDELFQ